MSDRVYNGVLDKTTWAPGPWHDEPDKIQWVDETTGLDCLIVRNHHGALCGYVGVPPGHPAHGRLFDDIDGTLEVHRGLSYSDRCQEDAQESRGICHVPAPGRPADVWWLGFDCQHAWDLAPGFAARERELGLPAHPPFGETYKTIAYVREEVARLAAQLAVR